VKRLRASLLRVLAMTRKEFRQLARDRLSLGFVVGIPSLQLVLFGYAINLDVRHIPTAVLDRSGSALSRQMLGELEATQTFRIVAQVSNEPEAIRLIESSEVGAVVMVPPDFDRRLLRGRGAEISILADASNPTVASAVALTGQGLGQHLASRMQPYLGEGAPPGGGALRRLPRDLKGLGPRADLVHRTMTMMLMTALAIVRERERGTFEFLIATPVSRIEVMVGKIVPYLVVGHVQVTLILVLGALLFQVPLHGSLLDLGVGALPFLIAMLSMGLLISSAARTQFQATQMSFFFFLPSMLLSGFMFPFEAMPVPAQWIGEVLPLTHFLRVVRGILLKGAPIEALLVEVAAISTFAIVTLGLAVASFRKRLG
jgi:ABC-2 type transport system permease protein